MVICSLSYACREHDADSWIGRAWTYKELSVKDWDDLYKLYWTCILEANRLATRKHELARLHAGFGLNELSTRQDIVSHKLPPALTFPYDDTFFTRRYECLGDRLNL